tara:strand:- start:257369 stop:259174 length:1806 start_codon:yes stop_codon:yes gene_type:complete
MGSFSDYVNNLFDLSLGEQSLLEIGEDNAQDDQSIKILGVNAAVNTPEDYDNRVINFNYIIETGLIPGSEYLDNRAYQPATDLDPEKVDENTRYEEIKAYIDNISQYKGNNQTIDLTVEDALTRTMQSVQENVLSEIANDSDIQGLLSKEVWSKQDRASWEKFISEATSAKIAEVPGLDSYRLQRKAPGSDLYDQGTAEKRAQHVNELSKDIENGTGTIEFDCETMSIVEGIILQRLEHEALPSKANDQDGYKYAANYFYASGNAAPDYEGDTQTGHAYIISSATGNIIEGTIEGRYGVYNEHIDDKFTFESFVDGKPFIGKDQSFYSGRQYDYQEYNAIVVGHFTDALYSQIDTKLSATIMEDGTSISALFKSSPELPRQLLEQKISIENLEEKLSSSGEDGEQKATLLRAVDQHKEAFASLVSEHIKNIDMLDTYTEGFTQLAFYTDLEEKANLLLGNEGTFLQEFYGALRFNEGLVAWPSDDAMPFYEHKFYLEQINDNFDDLTFSEKTFVLNVAGQMAKDFEGNIESLKENGRLDAVLEEIGLDTGQALDNGEILHKDKITASDVQSSVEGALVTMRNNEPEEKQTSVNLHAPNVSM